MTDLLFLAIVLAQFIDLGMTANALDIGAVEKGPVRYLFALFSSTGALCIAKFLGIGIIGYGHAEGMIAGWAYWAIALGYAGLILWNAYQIDKQKQLNEKR